MNHILMIYVLDGLIWALVCSIVAKNKGYEPGLWPLWGLIFQFFAILVLLSKPQNQKPPQKTVVEPKPVEKTWLSSTVAEMKNDKLNKVKSKIETWNCPTCGLAHRIEEAFCTCGTPQPDKYGRINNEWKCKSCGNANPSGRYICQCGMKKSENDKLPDDTVNKETSGIKTETENIELIKKYKELLDIGAITPEEYEEKKKALL